MIVHFPNKTVSATLCKEINQHDLYIEYFGSPLVELSIGGFVVFSHFDTKFCKECNIYHIKNYDLFTVEEMLEDCSEIWVKRYDGYFYSFANTVGFIEDSELNRIKEDVRKHYNFMRAVK